MSVEVRAQNTISMTSVKAIKDATDESASLLESMRQSAEDAGTTLTGIYADAESAKSSADVAYTSAEIAQTQLSIVENVVGVLDLLSKNGTYELTIDNSPIEGKWYFTRSGTSPDYVYSVVNNIGYDYLKTKDTVIDPTKTYYEYDSVLDEYVEVESPVVADIGDYYEYSNSPYLYGYYELTGVDQAVQNYVSSQLVVDGSGLWLKTAGMQTKVLLSATDGVVLYGTNGQVVGKYGNTAQIGDGNSFHISLSGTRLGFWKGTETDPNNEIAYISGQQLYITKSVVLQQMDLGIMEIDGGLGQWSWKVHPNGVDGKNNLNLKWVG